VLHEEHAAGSVNDQGAHAESEPAREPPKDMQDSPDDRLERAADGLKLHTRYLRLAENDRRIFDAGRIGTSPPARLKSTLERGPEGL
jgi:hypothetical protein